MIIKCKVCGKNRKVDPWQIKKGHAKFCSHKCQGVWIQKNKKGKNSPAWKGGRINIKCVICNNKFKALPSQLKHGFAKFCSRKCCGTWKSKNITQEKNHNWKGGATPLLILIRNSHKSQIWRQEVFKRDSFVCQKCKQVGGQLHAHHEIKFSVLMENVKYNLPLLPLYEAAMIYKPLWDISNGTTFCEKCHKKIHRRTQNDNNIAEPIVQGRL